MVRFILKFIKMSRSVKTGTFYTLLFGIFMGYYITTLLRNWILQPPNCLIHKMLDEKNLTLTSSIHASESLFIAVTFKKDELKRVKAIMNTWGQNVPGRIRFFTSENVNLGERLPITVIKNMTTYGNFVLYQHLHDHYRDAFQYFITTPADSYVRINKLQNMLQSLSKITTINNISNKNSTYDTSDLNLLCIQDSTTVLSDAALQIIRRHIKKCFSKWSINNIIDGPTIGRCYEEIVGVPCVQPYQITKLFRKTKKIEFTYFVPEDETIFNTAVVISPVTDQSMYYLYLYDKGLIIKRKETSIIKAQREKKKFIQTIVNKNANLLDKFPSINDNLNGIFVDHLGSDLTNEMKINFGNKINKFEAFGNFKEFSDVANMHLWNFISKEEKEIFYSENTDKVLTRVLHYLEKVLVNKVNSQDKDEKGLNFEGLHYAYSRYCPFYGMQTVLDLSFQEKSQRALYRKHSYVQVPFGPLMIREVPSKKTIIDSIILYEDLVDYSITDNHTQVVNTDTQISEIIYMILALSQRFATFQRFMDDYEKEVLQKDESVVLIISLYGSDLANRKDVKDLVKQIKSRYLHANINVLEGETSDSKARALKLATSKLFVDDLLFIIDVDMTFKVDVFDRIRWHTIQGRQVYFPIVFSEYLPTVARNANIGSYYDHYQMDDNFGLWRAFGYGMVSIYLSDLSAVGGFDTKIIGWGVEDVDLFDKVVKKRLEIMRSPDPSLVHIYHDKVCSKRLNKVRYSMCGHSSTSVYASSTVLWKYIEAHPDIYNFSRKAPKKVHHAGPKRRYSKREFGDKRRSSKLSEIIRKMRNVKK